MTDNMGLKFIPSPPIEFAKQDILKDFDDFILENYTNS
jgi:hypothetical protein